MTCTSCGDHLPPEMAESCVWSARIGLCCSRACAEAGEAIDAKLRSWIGDPGQFAQERIKALERHLNESPVTFDGTPI